MFLKSLSLLLLMSAPGFSQVFSKFEITNPSEEILEKIADNYEIIDRNGDRYFVLVPILQSHNFRTLVPDANLLARNVDQDLIAASKDPSYLASYRNFEEVKDWAKELAEKNKNIMTYSEYGKSKQGRPLILLKLSDPVALPIKQKPKLFLDSATHGDELITVETLIALVDELVNGYGTNQRITSMVKNTEIYIAPVINPDGFVRRQRYANGVDPNRQYPWPKKPNRAPVQCIKEVIKLFETHRFEGAMTFHASGKMVMYPWAYTRRSVDDDVFESTMDSLTADMALNNGYRHGQISKVIYIAKGSSADYYYWKFGTLALAIELTTSKIPHSRKIPLVVDEAREMTWRFIEHFYRHADFFESRGTGS